MSGSRSVEFWPTDKPIPYAKNARVISPSAIDTVAASIREFGFQDPIIVNEEGVILAGHTRLTAAKKLGLTEVPVLVAEGLTPAQQAAFRIMENRSHQNSSWEMSLLGEELIALRELDFDLTLTGFESNEIAAFFAEDTSLPLEENQAPAPEKPISHTLKFSDEQFHTVLRAIQKVREMESDTNIEEARACELALADWLA